ncbi:TPA: hypothetical protein HA324_06325 [Candidatus Thalassarchaeaceae archaeon]|jgi:hypothetical protein|nr:hypothetical protein [Euryarchaeota archaeon]MDG1547223.1 hypothetical protein [Candidatus Thalassarchaeaceae archaeon]DAC63397.1 MAG TPA: hypothetical protein D7I04_03100 [Candidatus Poseidoniales archaeon]MDC0502085.1 hypothetical protein [Euryarchaeota archaeon]MDG1554389.1 hypothetical protein [Candidatus Thalassarchaeaceae archaeon]|tara:strand:+ start:236 stop:1018 length:783 start_codon:yes stop_codon:yes gene_type:complete
MDVPSNRAEVEELIRLIIDESYPTLGAILAISAYSIFVFIFYRNLAKRDLITLNLDKYSNNLTGKIKKYIKSITFVIQYILIIPILLTFWTLVLAIILTLLSSDADHSRNALIATSVVGSVRILSYWTEDLSRDVAKMLPFGVLGVFLVGDAQVQVSEIRELLQSLEEIATSFVSSLFLIAVVEGVLRSITSIINLISLRRGNLSQKKEISKIIGRSVKDIRKDIQDDGELNYSAGKDVEEMQIVLEDAVGELLEDISEV